MGSAVHYGDASQPITISVVGNDPEMVKIAVRNSGVPIYSETQKSMFQPWMRGLDTAPENGTHLGLGLHISKLIVEAHGGEISVTSNEETGTTFSVQLPRG